MSEKISNKTLGVILGVLVIAVIYVLFIDSGNERTFRESLVNIDTASVTKINIYPKSKAHKEVSLFKDGKEWYVALSNGKRTGVPPERIKNIFAQLLSIKPKSLAARGTESWKDFQVDSSGTAVKIFEGEKNTLDIVIGRFTFKQPRSMSTFVRLASDTDVYEVDGFLEMTFNHDENSFRNNSLIKSDYNKWKKLTFTYPADSSFQLIKENGVWNTTGAAADSQKVITYLRLISSLNGAEFVNDLPGEFNLPPSHKLTIETETDGNIEITGGIVNDRFIINSSMNKDAFFNGSGGNLAKQLFIGQKSIIFSK